MKTLIVGYGYMGQIRKLVVDRLPELEVAGICDPFLTSEQMSVDCPCYSEYRDAIDTLRPEIVMVCTPNRFSPDVCVYSIKRCWRWLDK